MILRGGRLRGGGASSCCHQRSHRETGTMTMIASTAAFAVVVLLSIVVYPTTNNNNSKCHAFNLQPIQRPPSSPASSFCGVSSSAVAVAPRSYCRSRSLSILSSTNAPEEGAGENRGEEEDDDGTGASLAAEFFKMAQQKGINLDAEDLIEEEEEEDYLEGAAEDEGLIGGVGEDEDEDEEANIPQGAINAFLGYDTGDVGERLAGNVSLTDDQLYSEVKERVLDTAGGFVEYVKGAQDDSVGDDTDDDDDTDEVSNKPKPYEPPTTVPDSELTAGEVIILVLSALLNNDVPTKNKGVEILFGYSSDGSQIKNEVGLTPSEYADFLKETEYKVLFDHRDVSIDKADYSFDGKKAFFTARLQTGPAPLDTVSVNFILSTKGVDDDSCWLIDSMLIRPQSMRRRRRR